MIIGIDASRANKKRKTGTEWYSYYLIKYFAQIDKENQYILYTDKPLMGGLLDLTKGDVSTDDHEKKVKFRLGNQTIKSPHNNFKAEILRWPFSYFWTLGRLSLEMLIHKPDVLFVPAHGLPLIRPKKTINTIHDISFMREKKIFERNKLGPEMVPLRKIIGFFIKLFTFGKYSADSLDYLEWSTNYSLKKSKKVIAVSNFTKQEILKIYKDVKEEKIKVVYNGFNNRLYRKIDDKEKIKKVLEKYGIEGPYILYVGRLEKKKNTPFLVEGFATARHYNNNIKEKLVLVGDASFGYEDVVYTINEYGLRDEVIIPGWVEEEDMPYIFNGAVAFVFPTLHEGFGIPILQAFACGVPVIASDIPVLRETTGDAVYFFNNKEKETLGRAIEKITQDENLRKDLIEKGLKRAQDFSWRKCAQETLEVIKNI